MISDDINVLNGFMFRQFLISTHKLNKGESPSALNEILRLC